MTGARAAPPPGGPMTSPSSMAPWSPPATAVVEDRIRTGKDTGLGRFPSRQFAINAAWLTAVMLAVDLLAWTQTMLLHDQPNPGPSRAEHTAPPAPARRRPPGPR